MKEVALSFRLSKKLRSLRKGRDYSLTFVANSIGVTHNTYVDIEKGKESIISIDRIANLAELYEMQAWELLRLCEEKAETQKEKQFDRLLKLLEEISARLLNRL